MSDEREGNWFDNDPEWAELREHVNGRPFLKGSSKKSKRRPKETKHKPEKPLEVAEKAPETPKQVRVSVDVTLPKLPKLKLPRLTRKQRFIAGGVAGGALLLTAGIIAIPRLTKPEGAPQVQGTSTEAEAKPDFATALPEGKQEATSSQKVAYDPERKLASFTDSIDFIDVTVSEQPVPAPFKADPDGELKKLADNISATKVINEANPKAYLGNSVKGPQTVVFVKKDLLIFIFSPSPIDESSWAEYITKLL